MLLDIFIIAVAVICVAINVKKGFVRGILGIVGFVAAAVIAIYFGNAFCAYAQTTQSGIAAKSKIYNVTYERLYESSQDGTPAIEKLNLPPFIKESVLKNANDLTAGANDKISEAVSQSVFEFLCRGILFAVLALLIGVAKMIILSLVKLPVLRQADKALGFAAGIVNALLYAYLIILAVYVLQSVCENEFLYKAVSESKIYALVF